MHHILHDMLKQWCMQQVHGRLLQLRFLLEATPSVLSPAELAEVLTAAAEGLIQHEQLLDTCRCAVVRTEYLRSAATLCSATLPPQAADMAAACQPATSSAVDAADDTGWHELDSVEQTHAHCSLAFSEESLASSPAFGRLAAVLQQGCRHALRLPLSKGCGGNGAACSPDAHSPMLSLFLKEAAHLLFGPMLCHIISLHSEHAGTLFSSVSFHSSASLSRSLSEQHEMSS